VDLAVSEYLKLPTLWNGNSELNLVRFQIKDPSGMPIHGHRHTREIALPTWE
jgi:hypothetical protein